MDTLKSPVKDKPYFSITVEGQDLSPLVQKLAIEENDARADLATLTFGDSSLLLADILHEGLSVEVDLGRADVHSLIFRGLITGMRADFPAQGQPQVEVQAMDSLIQMSLQPKTRCWWNTTVSQVVRDIAREYSLAEGRIEPQSLSEKEAPIEELRPRRQLEETDLAFLFRLAQDYDARLYVEHKDRGKDVLNFVSTKRLLKEKPIEESLRFNDNLEEFSVSFDVFATGHEQQLVTTDPLTGELVEMIEDLVKDARETEWEPDADRIARLGKEAACPSELIAKTKVKQKRIKEFWRRPPRELGVPSRSSSDPAGVLGDQGRRFGQTAQGRARGSIWLRPRRLVTVEGFGGRWSGDWYLAQVTHQLDVTQRTYVCSFVCTR